MGKSVTHRILEGIRRRQEDSELQVYSTEPSGAMGEDEDRMISVEEMEGICAECAQNMRERNMTGLKLSEALRSGLVEYDEEATSEAGVIAGSISTAIGEAKKDGWPKKLRKGRFSAYCRREGFSGPSVACAKKAMDSDDKSVRGMASFFMNTVKPGGKTASAVKGKEECAPEIEEQAPAPQVQAPQGQAPQGQVQRRQPGQGGGFFALIQSGADDPQGGVDKKLGPFPNAASAKSAAENAISKMGPGRDLIWSVEQNGKLVLTNLGEQAESEQG